MTTNTYDLIAKLDTMVGRASLTDSELRTIIVTVSQRALLAPRGSQAERNASATVGRAAAELGRRP